MYIYIYMYVYSLKMLSQIGLIHFFCSPYLPLGSYRISIFVFPFFEPGSYKQGIIFSGWQSCI